jgi:drug/metabolite transporter (DMT)-like permease
VIFSIIGLIFGLLSGGAADEYWLSVSGEWTLPRLAFHGLGGLMLFYVALCWLGAAIGTSPHRSIGTVFLAPLFVFLAQWAYGQGVIKAWREIRQTGGKAGVGNQIDDRIRTV